MPELSRGTFRTFSGLQWFRLIADQFKTANKKPIYICIVADWCTKLIELHWIYDQWRWSNNLCILILGCYPFPPVLHPLSLPCLLSPTPSPPGMTSFFFHPPPCTSPSSFSSSPPLTLPLFFLLAHFFSIGFLKKDCDKRALKINDRSVLMMRWKGRKVAASQIALTSRVDEDSSLLLALPLLNSINSLKCKYVLNLIHNNNWDQDDLRQVCMSVYFDEIRQSWSKLSHLVDWEVGLSSSFAAPSGLPGLKIHVKN